MINMLNNFNTKTPKQSPAKRKLYQQVQQLFVPDASPYEDYLQDQDEALLYAELSGANKQVSRGWANEVF